MSFPPSFGPAWRTGTRAAGERQNKKASCLCRAKAGSAGRFPVGYCCCFPDGVEHGINQANSRLPAGIWVIPMKPLLLTTHEEFRRDPRLANAWKINPRGSSWLAELPGCSPQILGSFPACKHDSLDWGRTGNCWGSAGGFAWTFIGFLLPSSQFERLCVGKRAREGGRAAGTEGTGGGGGRGPHYLFARTKYKAFVLG